MQVTHRNVGDMTSEQFLKSLTPAQRRMMGELAEPMKPTQRWWFFPRKNWRSLDILVELGMAETGDRDINRAGYRLTELGKLILGPIAFLPG